MSKKNYKKLYQDAVKEYKRMAWRLDKQLYRLEKASLKPQYKNILKYGYAKMVKEIQTFKPGSKRWGQSVPKGTDYKKMLKELNKRMSVMREIEKLPSFSIKRLKQVYGKAAATISKKIGLSKGNELTWQDVADFYGSSLAEVLDSQYGSATVVIALGKFKKMSPKQIDDLRQKLQENPDLKLDDDIAVGKVIKELIEKYQ